MSLAPVRRPLVVVAGILGASLLAATFTGCQSSPGGPQASSPFGPSSQQAGMGMPAQGMAAQGMPGQGMFGGMSAGGQQQSFMAETQRIGAQQGLTAQDVVAMSRSGVPDSQIAIAVQQRGANLRNTPGASQYLAQNGVNPAVLNASGPSGGFPSQMGSQPFASQGQPFAGPSMGGPHYGNPPFGGSQFGSPSFGTQVAANDMSGGMMPSRSAAPSTATTQASMGVASAPPMGGAFADASTGMSAPVQGAGYESATTTPGADPAPTAAGGMSSSTSQWRPLAR